MQIGVVILYYDLQLHIYSIINYSNCTKTYSILALSDSQVLYLQYPKLSFNLINYYHIGANCLGTPGTVLDLEALSRVPHGNYNLSGLSRIFKDPHIGLDYQASWKVNWL